VTHDSYRAKVNAAQSAAYVKAVVSQPTQASSVKAKMDRGSPTGIAQVKDNGS
jgi:hypothetical protein